MRSLSERSCPWSEPKRGHSREMCSPLPSLICGLRSISGLNGLTPSQLMAQRSIEGDTSFFVGNDTAVQESEAIPLAVQDAAVQFVSFLSEGW